MARKKKLEPTADRTTFYSDLAYMPTDYKESRLWMAQALTYAKLNSQVLQEPDKAAKYRRLDLDRQTYINLIDPKTPDGGGGKADYFSADFQAFPIDEHLDNILDGDIRTIPLNLVCRLADPVAKLLDQKEKDKILSQRMVRALINDIAKDLGIPKIGDSVDPFKWIQNFTAEEGAEKIDVVGDAIDQIKTKIKDDDSLRLFQLYGYKNGLELAMEIGIKYYLLDQNEWQVKFSDLFLRDLMHFNKFCGRWAIDKTTGQGVVKYIDPCILRSSPFKDKNGDDAIHHHYEEDVSFAEFERLVGTDMTDEEKRDALKLQKEQGWITHNPYDFADGSRSRNSSRVRLGWFTILTQQADAFAEDYVTDTSVWEREPLTWRPDKKEPGKRAKVYNVWYSCYYLPITATSYYDNSPAEWLEQSRFIFDISKDLDMMRYGLDKRYAKSSIVLWKNDKRKSWTDIKEAFMPKMHTLWHKFQNCIVQDVQGLAIDRDLLTGMLNAIDDANTNTPQSEPGQPTQPKGGKALIDQWKMLRQAGMAWLQFRDRNGNHVVEDPSKLFVPIDSGHLKKGEMYLLQAMNLYNLMTQALAKGGANEALQPEARTPVSGLELAALNAGKATYFLTQSYIEGVIVPYAMRCAHHIHTIAKENKTYDFKKRWEIFKNVVGQHNGAVIESIEDIKFENIGLTIANKEDLENNRIVLQAVIEKYAGKQITTAGIGLILGSDNYKQRLLELALEEGKAAEQAQLQAEAEHQRQMELQQMQLQIAQALTQAKTQGKDQNLVTEGKIKGMIDEQMAILKAQTMAQQKEQLLQNKLTENEQKAALEKEKIEHEKNLENAA